MDAIIHTDEQKSLKTLALETLFQLLASFNYQVTW